MTDNGTSGQNVPNMAEGLYLMDGIKGLLSLPQHSVDMLLTDPPYGTTRNYWDVPLPLPELWEAVKWAVKPNGAVLFFAQCPYDKVLGASNLSMLRYEWVWYKERGTGFLNANRAPLKKSENILVFYQKSPVYHPQFTYGKPYTRTHTSSGMSANYGKFVRQGTGSSDGRRYPGNVLFVPTVMGGIHPTQKPVELCEYFIKTYTDEGAVVAVRAAALSALKTPQPSTAPPSNALSRHGWPWSVAGKECNYRSIFHHLCRSPVALLPKGLAGGSGASLPHHEHRRALCAACGRSCGPGQRTFPVGHLSPTPGGPAADPGLGLCL